MAKTGSHIISSASGSVAGLTYQRSFGPGIQIRTKPIPHSAYSPNRSRVKSRFSSALRAWLNLDNNSRNKWNEAVLYAQSHTKTSSPPPTGRSAFIRFYIHALLIKESKIILSIPNNPPAGGLSCAYSFDSYSLPPVGQSGFRLYFHNANNFTIYQLLYLSSAQSLSLNHFYKAYSPNPFSISAIIPGGTRRIDCLGLIPNMRYFTRSFAISLSPMNLHSSYIQLDFISEQR